MNRLAREFDVDERDEDAAPGREAAGPAGHAPAPHPSASEGGGGPR